MCPAEGAQSLLQRIASPRDVTGLPRWRQVTARRSSAGVGPGSVRVLNHEVYIVNMLKDSSSRCCAERSESSGEI